MEMYIVDVNNKQNQGLHEIQTKFPFLFLEAVIVYGKYPGTSHQVDFC